MKLLRRYSASTIAVLGGMSSAVCAQDAAPVLEEVTVTGSFIRRSDYQLSSPIDVVQRDELESRAVLNVAEFVRDLPFNFGSAFASGRAFGNERGGGTINLRGLGASGTLVLINGRRQTQLPDAADNIVDVNSLIPDIMLERIEILKDGASATYGSDAIAGVANFITRDQFDGFTATARYNQFTHSNAEDYRFETLWGSGVGGRTHVVAAFSLSGQDAINGMAYTVPGQDPSMTRSTRFSTPASSPGEFVVPLRDENGQLIPGPAGQRRNVVDPECGNVVSTIPSVGTTPVDDPADALDCRYNFWGDNGSQSEIKRVQAMLRATSDITDRITLDGEFGYAYVRSRTSYTAGETSSEEVFVPGHNPGNTYFRAVDANGNPLYAVSSGVSAGLSRDGEEVFLPLRDANGNVVLTDDPTNPASGIPFYEDVFFSGRLVNSQGNRPTNNAFGPGEYAWSRPSVATNHIMRAAGGLTAELGGSWQGRANIAYSRYSLNTNGVPGVGLKNELTNALSGFGGPTCKGDTPGQNGCYYFNPFGNSVFATPGSAAANSDEVLNYIFPMFKDVYESKMLEVNAVASGELFDLPGGPVSVAVGYQHRHHGLIIDYDISANTGNRTSGVVAQDIDVSRSIDAVFAEASVPLYSNSSSSLELNLALRYEDLGNGLDTTDPKVGLVWGRNDGRVTVRGSYGTSFIAPSLYRMYAVAGRGVAVQDCPVSMGPPCTGEDNLRIVLYENGNPNLQPEESKAWSLGTTVDILDNLTLDVSWWKFEFDNKIATQSPTDVVREFPNGSPENPVVRDSTGRIVSVTARFFNQASVVTEGVDFGVSYFRSLGRGDLNLNLSGTYVSHYKVQDRPGGPIYDAAGATNDRLTAPPQSDLRFNARATWTSGPHSITGLLRYYSPLEFTLDPTIEISAFTPLDLAYTYTMDIGGRATQLTFGSTNVLNEGPPVVPPPGFQPFIPGLHDTRGRAVWFKVGVTF